MSKNDPDTFIAYAIQRKSDGGYIPYRWRRGKNGSTHDKPEIGAIPRLFKSHKAAQSFLTRWLRGKWYDGSKTVDLLGPGTGLGPMSFYVEEAGRDPKDMSIVKFDLIEIIEEKQYSPNEVD